jgi:hypothetical protein
MLSIKNQSAFGLYNGVLLTALFLLALYIIITGFASAVPIHCYYRVHYGIECPSCGLTRALQHFSKGDFGGAYMLFAGFWWFVALFAIQFLWRSASAVFYNWYPYKEEILICTDAILTALMIFAFYGKAYGWL